MRLVDAFRLADAAGRAVPLEGLRAAAQPELQGVLLLPQDRGSPEKRAPPARAAPAGTRARSALLVAALVPCVVCLPWAGEHARRAAAKRQSPVCRISLLDRRAQHALLRMAALASSCACLLASGCARDARSARQGARSG